MRIASIGCGPARDPADALCLYTGPVVDGRFAVPWTPAPPERSRESKNRPAINRAPTNWRFKTVPQPGMAGREIPVPRGRVLGGSGSINGMVYFRGHPTDYDDWADAGAPEGEPRDDLQVPPVAGLDATLDLHTPEFTPEIVGGPLAEFDEYRCFLIDPQLDHDMFLTGYEVTPGNPALVHHLLAMPVDLDAIAEGGQTNAQRIQALDDESPDRDGWPCFSQAGEGVEVEGLPVTWAPGMGAVEYPAGTGVRIAAGRKIVVQLHYNLHDPALAGQSDRSHLGLRLAESVEREGFFDIIDLFIDTLFESEPDSLEPGKPSVKYDWSVPIGDHYLPEGGEIEVYGIFPHMHERGRKWNARLVNGDETQCIGDVQAWDFNWQLYYFYEQPQIVRPGDRLEVTCDFDTRGAEGPVTPGWGTQNEMCLAGLYVVP